MKDIQISMHAENLPIKQKFKHLFNLTRITVILVTAASLLGLFWPKSVYPTAAIQQEYRVNDAVNLILGVPLILGPLWLTKKGKLSGLLLWPGALLFVLYTYTAYLFTLPFSFFSLLFLAILFLSGWCFAGLIQWIDREAVAKKISANVPILFPAILLLLFGVVFSTRAAAILFQAFAGRAAISAVEMGTLAADIILSLVWIIGGISLLRRKTLGITFALGLLYTSLSLNVGLLILFCLQPLMTGAPFLLQDTLVIAVFACISLAPFLSYLRAIFKTGISE